MVQTATNLQQLKGVGSVLAKRLQGAGLDSFASIAQASKEELSKIGGLNAHNIPAIQDQARQLASADAEGEQGAEALQKRLGEVREQLQTLAETTRERFRDELDSKCGRKLACDLARIQDSLGQIDFDGKKGARRAGKALSKVQKRVSGLAEDAGLKKVRKALKRAKKAVLKAVP